MHTNNKQMDLGHVKYVGIVSTPLESAYFLILVLIGYVYRGSGITVDWLWDECGMNMLT